MAKAEIIDPAALAEPIFPKGNYNAIIEDCQESRGNWGPKHQNIQRFQWRTRFLPHEDTPEEMWEQSLSEMTPAGEDCSNIFLRFLGGLGLTVEQDRPNTFDSAEVIGKEVVISVVETTNKQTQESRNRIINMVAVAEA